MQCTTPEMVRVSRMCVSRLGAEHGGQSVDEAHSVPGHTDSTRRYHPAACAVRYDFVVPHEVRLLSAYIIKCITLRTTRRDPNPDFIISCLYGA